MSPVALSDPLAKDAHLLRCGPGHNRYYEDYRRDQLSVSVTMYVGEGLRHLIVSPSILGDGRPAPYQQDDYNALPVMDPIPDLPVLDPISPPKPGEPIAPQFGSPMDLSAPISSTLVAPLSSGGTCGDSSYLAVFTTVDVDAALDDLAAQLSDDRHPVEYVVVTGDGVTHRTFTVEEGAGGGFAQVTTAERPDRSTIFISAC